MLPKLSANFAFYKGIGEIDNNFVPSAYSMMPATVPVIKSEKGKYQFYCLSYL